MSEPTPDAELAALRQALGRLRPAPDPIDLGPLLYRAGQEAARRRGRAWPWTTAASSLVAATLAAVLLFRPVPPTAEHFVVIHDPAPAPPAGSAPLAQTPLPAAPPARPADADGGPGLADALRLRRAVLADGVDALPEPAPWPAAPGPRDPDPLLDTSPGGRPGSWRPRLKNSLQPGGA